MAVETSGYGATWSGRKGVWYDPFGKIVDRPVLEKDGSVRIGYCRMPTWQEGVQGWQTTTGQKQVSTPN